MRKNYSSEAAKLKKAATGDNFLLPTCIISERTIAMIHLTDTEKTVIRILAHTLHKPLHEISTQKEFFSELTMDDTDYLLTIVDIERQFRLVIPDEIAFSFRNARQIINYLNEQKLAA